MDIKLIISFRIVRTMYKFNCRLVLEAETVYLGNPWGFIIRSGQMPRSVKGKSSCWTMVPQTPFCPCLLLNLSPTYAHEIEIKSGIPKNKARFQNDTNSKLSYLWSTSMPNQEFYTQVIILVRIKCYFIHNAGLSFGTFECLISRLIVTANANKGT